MKIYRRKEFLKLPTGTLFLSGEPFLFNNLRKKEDSLENDYYYRDLSWIDSLNDGDQFYKLDKMLENGESFPINNSIERDGLFDDNELYMVYEEEDLNILISLMQEAINIS